MKPEFKSKISRWESTPGRTIQVQRSHFLEGEFRIKFTSIKFVKYKNKKSRIQVSDSFETFAQSSNNIAIDPNPKGDIHRLEIFWKKLELELKLSEEKEIRTLKEQSDNQGPK